MHSLVGLSGTRDTEHQARWSRIVVQMCVEVHILHYEALCTDEYMLHVAMHQLSKHSVVHFSEISGCPKSASFGQDHNIQKKAYLGSILFVAEVR